MKKYCLDTSGLSNPLYHVPEDIHPTLWGRIRGIICAGSLATTAEIYDEIIHIQGDVGRCLCDNEANMVMDLMADGWDWPAYIEHSVRMQNEHAGWISEYNNNRKATVGLKDLTIVALGKTLGLPVISMESGQGESDRKKRIPHICRIEGVVHLTFNEFLRAEGISI